MATQHFLSTWKLVVNGNADSRFTAYEAIPRSCLWTFN